jgi:LCP family protein required for cell wall assembly
MPKPKTKIIWTGFIIRIFILLLSIIVIYTIFFLINLNKNLNKAVVKSENTTIMTDNNNSDKTKEQIKEDLNEQTLPRQRINILLLGLDGGSRKSGTYLTDTIMLASINPQTYQSALLSIPRDLYVKIPGTKYHTKINALYAYGLRNEKKSSQEAVELIRSAVEEITGQKIPYYIIIDFAGFQKVIELIGGINIDVPYDIKDTRYPGPNYSYETFELKKGWQHLDAETALKYARVRHTKGGDFGRAYRQQQILTAVREKALSLKILTNPFKVTELLNILGNHLKTNIDKREMLSLLKLSRNINIHQTTTQVLDAWSKDSLLKSTHLNLGGVPAYVLIPKIKTYAQIQNLAKNIFNLKKIKEEKSQIEREGAKISICTKRSTDFTSFKKIISDWNYKNIHYADGKYAQDCPLNQDAIISYSGKEKLFTLNDLAQKLDLHITYYHPTSNSFSKDKTSSQKTKKTNSPDVLLCLTGETINFFIEKKEEQQNDNFSDEMNNSTNNIFNSQGQVLFNK